MVRFNVEGDFSPSTNMHKHTKDMRNVFDHGIF